ncbi:transglutaminase-like domain-containing protein [Agromyces atrinae]|uniref:Transglutaminase family protein n=1 Tax=Agromyces atrinae TaxID=592376 RepID=A0A4Q2M130_9MICO|nr:transglutaminase family protein [Agromyces atrinae]NYD68371.1 transglutaminase-like putative cysteine protease [Agromyces atrinae]RXZ85585.1 transglutaminase family protein [Agromyces atrinae]
MLRTVSAHLELTVFEPAHLAFSVAVAPAGARESMLITFDGTPIESIERDDAGNRLHTLDVPAGRVILDYSAEFAGRAPAPVVDEVELLRYLRPSRYCESDALAPTARAEFGGLKGADVLAAVSSWVGQKLAYVPGSSLPTDGAVRTLLSRQGVCRDYAHLVIALLRALDVPARLVAVYAPGLDPMDFHAVAEAYVEGAWHVVDATLLAPRASLLRISTGRDAADTAFLSSFHGALTLDGISVGAVVDALPGDDPRDLAVIG